MADDDYKDKVFTVGVHGCARCKGNHDAVEFIPLLNHPRDTTHYGICPTTNQPILMQAVDDKI